MNVFDIHNVIWLLNKHTRDFFTEDLSVAFETKYVGGQVNKEVHLLLGN